MILTCEQCHTRYLVPQDAIGRHGRMVRCTACAHQWFQEPDEEAAPLPPEEPVEAPPVDMAVDAPAEEPIPEGVMPDPDDVALPALPEDVMTDGAGDKSYPRTMGALGAAAVFLLIGGAMYALHQPLVRLWPPASYLYELGGLKAPLPGEGLIFDKLTATVTLAADGGRLLTIEGSIVNLKDHEIEIPPVQTTLLLEGGRTFDSWQQEPPEPVAAPGADIPFKATYPEIPNDVREVTVSFREAARAVIPVEKEAEGAHDDADASQKEPASDSEGEETHKPHDAHGAEH